MTTEFCELTPSEIADRLECHVDCLKEQQVQAALIRRAITILRDKQQVTYPAHVWDMLRMIIASKGNVSPSLAPEVERMAKCLLYMGLASRSLETSSRIVSVWQTEMALFKDLALICKGPMRRLAERAQESLRRIALAIEEPGS